MNEWIFKQISEQERRNEQIFLISFLWTIICRIVVRLISSTLWPGLREITKKPKFPVKDDEKEMRSCLTQRRSSLSRWSGAEKRFGNKQIDIVLSIFEWICRLIMRHILQTNAVNLQNLCHSIKSSKMVIMPLFKLTQVIFESSTKVTSGRPALSPMPYEIKSTIARLFVLVPGKNPRRSSHEDSVVLWLQLVKMVVKW